jgi:hypothetical protein
MKNMKSMKTEGIRRFRRLSQMMILALMVLGIAGVGPLRADPPTSTGAAVLISGNQTIAGTKNFSGTLQIGGVSIGSIYQPLSSNLTTFAGIAASANVQTLLGAANFAAFKSSLSLGNVENTALSTWAGSANITTVGAVTATSINGLTLAGNDGAAVTFGAGGTVAYTGNHLGAFAATTSAQLAGVMSDETGSGAVVFGTGPTLFAPEIVSNSENGGVLFRTPDNAWGGGDSFAFWIAYGGEFGNELFKVPYSSSVEMSGYFGHIFKGGATSGRVGININSAHTISFGSDNDAGISRTSAGVLEINNGTASGAGALKVNGGVTVGLGGSEIKSIFTGGTTFDCPSIAADGGVETTTMTVTGTTTNSVVVAVKLGGALEAGVILSARGSAANTVELSFVNTTASPIDPNGATFLIIVFNL